MVTRTAAGFTAISASTAQYAVPTTGQTVSVTQTGASTLNLVIDPAGTLATLTIALPTGSFDGQRFSLMTSQALTGVTMTTATGSIVGAITTAAANAFATYVWSTTATKWYRIG